MTPYELWRYFGPLPPAPEIAFARDPDEAVSRGIEAYREDPGNPEALASLISIALRFSRLEMLEDAIGADDWDSDPAALLQRARLRFFQALAERPEDPNASLLDSAADDFREASDDDASAADAAAGLARIHAVRGDWAESLRLLRRTSLIRGRSSRPALAGAYLFLGDWPRMPLPRRRRCFRTARRLLAASGGVGAALPLALVEWRLGRRDAAFRRLEAAAEEGDSEARFALLRMEADLSLDDSADGDSRDLLEAISRYKEARPSDPRAFIVEGDLLQRTDPDTANMAWRSALILDERHSEAWSRLGDLYRTAWERRVDALGATWLEAAGDAYLKAVSLDPLDPYNRTALGMVERDSGRPARAVASLQGSLALDDTDLSARRWLAMSWMDLSYSPDLDPPARRAAAGRSREEWRRLLDTGPSPFDILGYARSLAVEGDRSEELRRILAEIASSPASYEAEELVTLAEDCIASGERELGSYVLDAVEPDLPEDPRVHGLRGELAEETDPAESVRRYLRAAASAGPGEGDYVHWLISASSSALASTGADGAEAIVRAGLGRLRDDRDLLRTLASILSGKGCSEEALESYRAAIARNPEDRDLLEDAVWFGRESGYGSEAEGMLRDALERNPEDSRLWNQLGVHLMETGWDEEKDRMGDKALDGALEAYGKALELNPENRIFLGNLGDALRQRGRWTEAAEALHRAVDGFGDDSQGAFALNSLARLEDEMAYEFEESDSSADDWASAGEHYGRAVGADPGNADFRKDYAWWLYRERRLDEALGEFLEAEELDPADDGLPYGAYSCRRDLGDDAEAAADLERALALKPDDPGYLADKADLLASLGNLEDAEGLYGRAVEFAGNVSWIWQRLAALRESNANEADGPLLPPSLPSRPGAFAGGASLFGRERTEEGDRLRRAAADAWERALLADPGNKFLKGRLGAVLMDLGRREEARDLLEASLSHGGDPGDAEALDRLGKLDMATALATGNEAAWSSAGERFETASRSDPLAASYHADSGYRHWLLEDYGPAADAFIEAHDREPGIPEYAANAGLCASAAGRNEEAEVYLRRALALGGGSAEWWNALGLVLLALDETDAAVEAFRSACLASPSSDEYAANLAMAYKSDSRPDGPLQ